MEIDDHEMISAPFCGQNINEPIQLISFNVELKHLSHHFNARLERKRLNSPAESNYELLKSIPFDEKSRSFTQNVFNPTVGYRYRLYWGDVGRVAP